jgi:glyoxylase-like metal-dependent hydrolase (beta-lactamase superfamily II)
MRVHHLNCITTCPIGGTLIGGRTRGARGRLVCHCLLLETSAGLVLVDTGIGLRDVARPRERISRMFLALVTPEFRSEMTAVRQVARLGLDPRDVRHVVLTHLDFDNAGGLDDFPYATVHLLADERDAAMARPSLLDRMRYRPQQWSTRANWHAYPRGEGQTWFGFDCVRDLDGLPPEVLLVPLVGHTLGHAGVAVDVGHGWMLHAGDAYFFHEETDPARPRCPPGLRLFQWMMEKDRRARRWNQDRLRALRRERGDEVTILCGHDASEFERVAGRPFDVPLGRATGRTRAGRPLLPSSGPPRPPAFS